MKLRCWQTLELGGTVHEDGSVEVEAKILEVGRKVQKGGAGEFEITPATLSAMVENHERDKSKGYEPPAVVGHPRDRDQAPAVGWIKALRAAEDGLYATVRFLGDFAKRVKAGEFRYSSPSFHFNWSDETGVERGAKLLDLGILNNPFQKGLGAFALAEVPDAAGAPGDQFSFPEVEDLKGADMADAIKLAEEVAGLKRDLEDKNNEMTSLSEKVATLTDERDAAQAKLSEVEAERDTLAGEKAEIQREKDSADINATLSAAFEAGTMTAAQVTGFGTDDFDGLAWLSESPFKDLDSLKSFIKTAPRVVDLGERKSLAGSGDAPDADKRKRIEQFADAAMAANPSLPREKALELAGKNA